MKCYGFHLPDALSAEIDDKMSDFIGKNFSYKDGLWDVGYLLARKLKMKRVLDDNASQIIVSCFEKNCKSVIWWKIEGDLTVIAGCWNEGISAIMVKEKNCVWLSPEHLRESLTPYALE